MVSTGRHRGQAPPMTCRFRASTLTTRAVAKDEGFNGPGGVGGFPVLDEGGPSMLWRGLQGRYGRIFHSWQEPARAGVMRHTEGHNRGRGHHEGGTSALCWW
jgi:hypothetical protein